MAVPSVSVLVYVKPKLARLHLLTPCSTSVRIPLRFHHAVQVLVRQLSLVNECRLHIVNAHAQLSAGAPAASLHLRSDQSSRLSPSFIYARSITIFVPILNITPALVYVPIQNFAYISSRSTLRSVEPVTLGGFFLPEVCSSQCILTD